MSKTSNGARTTCSCGARRRGRRPGSSLVTDAELALLRGVVGAQRALAGRTDGPAAFTHRALQLAVAEWCWVTGLDAPTDAQLGPLPRLPPAAKVKPPLPANVVDARHVFTGESCRNCGGVRLRRTGSCLTCEDCGEPGGCS